MRRELFGAERAVVCRSGWLQRTAAVLLALLIGSSASLSIGARTIGTVRATDEPTMAPPAASASANVAPAVSESLATAATAIVESLAAAAAAVLGLAPAASTPAAFESRHYAGGTGIGAKRRAQEPITITPPAGTDTAPFQPTPESTAQANPEPEVLFSTEFNTQCSEYVQGFGSTTWLPADNDSLTTRSGICRYTEAGTNIFRPMQLDGDQIVTVNAGDRVQIEVTARRYASTGGRELFIDWMNAGGATISLWQVYSVTDLWFTSVASQVAPTGTVGLKIRIERDTSMDRLTISRLLADPPPPTQPPPAPPFAFSTSFDSSCTQYVQGFGSVTWMPNDSDGTTTKSGVCRYTESGSNVFRQLKLDGDELVEVNAGDKVHVDVTARRYASSGWREMDVAWINSLGNVISTWQVYSIVNLWVTTSATRVAPPGTVALKVRVERDTAMDRLTIRSTPWVAFNAPIGSLRQQDRAFEVAWTETSLFGVSSRSLQRQRAPSVDALDCATANYVTDGQPSPAASPTMQSELQPGYCYRWQQTIVDSQGDDATAISGAVFIAFPPGPVTTFEFPAADYEVLADIDIEDSTLLAGWPGTRVLVGDDHEMALTGVTEARYGPRFAAVAGERWRLSIRPFPSGPHAEFEICFWDSGDAMTCGGAISEGDQRTQIVISEATAPAGAVEAGVRFYHAYYTSYYDDLRFERLDQDADDTVTVNDALTVAWTEAPDPQGLPIAARSLQRQRASASSYVGCATITFADDGEPTALISPLHQPGLESGFCYRWVQTLTDIEGNESRTISGTRYVVDHGLQLYAAPDAVEGATVPVSAVIHDRGGEPVDDFVGDLTISTDDPAAAFPDGTTFAMGGPDDQAGHTFRVQFGTPGTHIVTVRGANAQTASTVVQVAEVGLDASAPAQVYANTPFLLVVDPRDANQRLAASYVGTVSFTTSDPAPTFYDASGTPPSRTLSCSCDGGEEILTRLSTVGVQTITVTDQFGNSDTVTVEVLPSPAAGANPVSRVDNVQWRHGLQADLYVTALPDAPPFTILAVETACDDAYDLTPINLRVDPAVDRFVEVTALVPNGGICPGLHLGEILTHTLQLASDDGQFWTRGVTQRYMRFAEVPGAANFQMRNPGDPIADYATTARPGGTQLLSYGDHTWAYGTQSLRIDFAAHERAFITGMSLGRPGITSYYAPWQAHQGSVLAPGVTSHVFDDITHVCYTGNSWQSVNSGWITYGTPSGYAGAIASGGGILAGAGSPTVSCSDPSAGGENPDLDDLLDAFNPKTWANRLNGIGREVDRFFEADPVDPFTGAFTQVVTDFDHGGLSPALSLTRTYRSDRAEAAAAGDAAAVGAFGRGWASTVDRRLVVEDAGAHVEVVGDDGGYLTFVRAADGSYSSSDLTGTTLAVDGAGYRLTSRLGAYSRYAADGLLLAFGDRSGRELTFAYDGNGHLASMTDGASRTASFTVDGAGRVTRVDLPDGRSVAFTYDADGDMATARDLAGNVTTFVTDGRGRMVEVEDAAGSTLLANTYDGVGRLIEQADALGYASHFEYDDAQRLTRFTDPRGAITTSCYDQAGRQTGRLDALGGLRSWTYDHNGHAETAVDELGDTTSFEHDADGQLTRLADPLGRSLHLAYRSDGQISSLIDQAGNRVEPAFDPSTGLLTQIVRHTPVGDPNPQSLAVAGVTYTASQLPETMTDGAGGVTTFEYDARGYPTAVIDPEGRRTTFNPDARGFVISSVDPAGNVVGADPLEHTIATAYDDMGRVLTSTNQLGQTTSYTYDEWGRLETLTTPLGFTTTHAYNLAGQLTSTTTELAASETATTTFEYDPAGNLIAAVDAENRRTEFDYDLLGRPTVTRDAAGHEWLTDYDAAGRAVGTTDPTGRTTQTTYDAAGRIAETIDPAGEPTAYGYDDLDRLITVTDPLEHATTYGYDWLGRQTEVSDPLDHATAYAYDDAGRVTAITDALDHTTNLTYNLAGQLTLVVDAEAGEWSFTYDDAGRLEQRTNARGKSESFAYDRAWRPTVVTDPTAQAWQTAYDADGRIDYAIDAELQTTDFTYDRAGRLLAVSPDSGSPINYSYDDSGRRLTMTDGNGSTAYGYDPVGRLATADRNGRLVAYAYDDAGRPTTVTYPGGVGSVGYGYDAAGRLDTIIDWAGRITSFDYDAASRLTAVARPNGVATAYGYDDADRTTSIVHGRAGADVLALAYGYDDADRLTSLTDDTGAATFTYDDLNRLLTADYPGTDDYTYAYDPAGNITGLATPDATVTRTYDDADRLITEDDGTDVRTFAYDDNGALLDDDAGRTFSYDALGRLTGVSQPDLALSYTLDGDGNRWAETADGLTTSFDLDLRGLSSVLSDGTRRYLPSDTAAGYEEAGAWHTGLTDLIGTPLAHIDGAGALSSIAHLDPFGAPRSATPAATSAFGFTGEWTDAAGLLNLRFRAYDPSLQRFFARDTFGGAATTGQSWNRYAYAGGNPFAYTDPSGHLWNAVTQHGGEIASIVASLVTLGGYDALMAVTGRDWLAGRDLEGWERGLIGTAAAAPFLGLAAKMLARIGSKAIAGLRSFGSSLHFAGGIPRFERASRAATHLDEVADLASGTRRIEDSAGRSGVTQRVDESGDLFPNLRRAKAGHVGGPGAGKRFSDSTMEAARAEADNRCVICGAQTLDAPGPFRSEIDHAQPKASAGSNDLLNAQNLCRTCNRWKGVRSTFEWLSNIGRLRPFE